MSKGKKDPERILALGAEIVGLANLGHDLMTKIEGHQEEIITGLQDRLLMKGIIIEDANTQGHLREMIVKEITDQDLIQEIADT